MEKYLPTYVFKSIYDIDLDKLFSLGKKVILADLDNTLISYHQIVADIKLLKWKENLDQIGFKIYLISNNNDKRLIVFNENFKADGYLVKAFKPSPKKLDKFLNDMKLTKEETIFIGDQLVTDIACANNLGIDSILVKTIAKASQKWYTKINRLRENHIIKKLKKIDIMKANMIAKLKEDN